MPTETGLELSPEKQRRGEGLLDSTELILLGGAAPDV